MSNEFDQKQANIQNSSRDHVFEAQSPFNIFLREFLLINRPIGEILKELNSFGLLRHGIAVAHTYKIAVDTFYQQGLIDYAQANVLYKGTGGVLLHDIGQMGVSPEGAEKSHEIMTYTNSKKIVNINSTLDIRPREVIALNKLHPRLGGKVLKLLGDMGILKKEQADQWSQIAFNHEEEHYLNGKKLGYPRREFRETDDPLYFAMAKLSDVTVALREKRSYKEPLSQYYVEKKCHDVLNDDLILKIAEQLKPWKNVNKKFIRQHFDKKIVNDLRNQIISIFVFSEQAGDASVNKDLNPNPIFEELGIGDHHYVEEALHDIWTKKNGDALMKEYERGMKIKNFDITRDEENR